MAAGELASSSRPAPWLQPLTERFSQLRQQQRLPHALLIDGAPGWGQAQLAALLTLDLLEVTGRNKSGDVAELAHPNLRWLEPNGANIAVDQVRAATHFANTTAQGGGAKVLVINQAHLLNLSSANALLKTLEEPGANTYLILATGYPARLLPTVRSRCQRFTVQGTKAQALQWLGQDDTGVDALLFEFGGAPFATKQAQRAGTQPLQPLLEKCLREAAPATLVADLLALAPEGADPAELGLRWLRYAIGQASGQVTFPALAACPQRGLFGFCDELLAVQRQLLASNSVNTKLQFERLLVLWRNLAAL